MRCWNAEAQGKMTLADSALIRLPAETLDCPCSRVQIMRRQHLGARSDQAARPFGGPRAGEFQKMNSVEVSLVIRARTGKAGGEPKTGDFRMGNQNHIWAFDLGKGSIGKAARSGNVVLHKASLLITAAFAQNKTGEDCPRRSCLKNAFDQVYPHGG